MIRLKHVLHSESDNVTPLSYVDVSPQILRAYFLSMRLGSAFLQRCVCLLLLWGRKRLLFHGAVYKSKR